MLGRFPGRSETAGGGPGILPADHGAACCFPLQRPKGRQASVLYRNTSSLWVHLVTQITNVLARSEWKPGRSLLSDCFELALIKSYQRSQIPRYWTRNSVNESPMLQWSGT